MRDTARFTVQSLCAYHSIKLYNVTVVYSLQISTHPSVILQIGVNAGHCQLYYSLCISLSESTNDMMDVRTCDGVYGIVGFRLDSADRDQGKYCVVGFRLDSADRDQGDYGVVGFRLDSEDRDQAEYGVVGSDLTLQTGIRVSMVFSGSDLTLRT